MNRLLTTALLLCLSAAVARAQAPAATPAVPAPTNAPAAAAPAITPTVPAAPATPKRDDSDLQGLPDDVRGEVLCKRDGDMKVPENLAAARAKVPDSYRAWVRAGLVGAVGSSPDADLPLGFGYGAVVSGSVGLLNPLYLGGSLRWLPTLGQSYSFQADAVAGLTFRSYGTEWIKAGTSVTNSGGVSIVRSWAGNCQVRRTDWTLIGGIKLAQFGGVAPAPGLAAVGGGTGTALQIGIQQLQRRDANSPEGMWNVEFLYDPIHAGFGAQFSWETQGIIIALAGPDVIYTGLSGGLLHGNYTPLNSTLFWFTLDLGAAFEL